MKRLCSFLVFFLYFHLLEANSLKPYLNYTMGKGIGFERGYSTAGLFFKVRNSNRYPVFFPYLDLRGHLSNDGQKGANLGVGARFLNPMTDKIIGGNVYYDITDRRHDLFHQLGFGFEYLGPCWDLRSNVYFPLNTEKKRSVPFDYSGGYEVRYNRIRNALIGLDIEFGWTIKESNPFSPWGLYLAAKPYYYCSNSGKKLSAVGIQFRLNMEIFSFLSLETGFSDDRLFHQRYYGKILFSIPLRCFCSCEENWKKITEIPRRNDFIVIKKHRSWKTNY